MFAREWPVLFVDDDPDLLAVSRLALKNLEVDGVPVRRTPPLARPKRSRC
jgi:hypothetical protein